MAWRRSLSEYSLFLSSYCAQHLLYSRKRIPANPGSILLVKLDHFGDILLSLPVLMNLREAYPAAHITVLAGSWVRSLLETHPEIDQVIDYNAPFFARTAPATPLIHRWQLLRVLRARRDELLVDLRGSWLTLIHAVLGKPLCRLDRASRNVPWRFDKDAPTHELARNLEILSPIPTPHQIPTWPVAAEQIQWAWSFLASEGIVLSRPLFALHPGSPVSIKRWPAEYFAELADALIAHYGAQVIMLGNAEERPIADQIQGAASGALWNLAGKTTLLELLGILRNCTGFIGIDSGPMHLAAAVGIPTVGLFGPSDASRFGPVGPHVCTIQAATDCCSPCMGERCREERTSCIEDIPVARVWNALEGLLESSGEP